jgi:hypothetical protein
MRTVSTGSFNRKRHLGVDFAIWGVKVVGFGF